jgi:hypothetical protein
MHILDNNKIPELAYIIEQRGNEKDSIMPNKKGGNLGRSATSHEKIYY